VQVKANSKLGTKTPLKTKLGLENLTLILSPVFLKLGGGEGPIPTVWGTLWITLNPSTKDF